jgi:peptidoglycan-associated lipoprotein
MRTTRPVVALTLALAALATACGSSPKKSAKSPDPGMSAEVEHKTEPAEPDSVTIAPELKSMCKIDDGVAAKFGYDSASLIGKSSGLDKLADCMTTGALKGKRVKLVGRADPRGMEQYNMVLGAARADAVRRYLSGHGVGENAMTVTSRGELDSTGTDESGWANDRRVDVELAQAQK